MSMTLGVSPSDNPVSGLGDVVEHLDRFYSSRGCPHTLDFRQPGDRDPDSGLDSQLYQVMNEQGYAGTVRITPKGQWKWRNGNEAVGWGTFASETYWINFFMGTKDDPHKEIKRRQHRDAFLHYTERLTAPVLQG